MSQISQIKKIYHAAIYVRLSKEDGAVASHEKTESNSIANQKSLIRDFLENKNDIEVVQEYVDDGFSGSNFERPAFQMMLEDIKKGKIDCVVTKDLSRFGREYIDSGMYIERLFPAMGVRFIAINDGIDSGEAKSQSDEIIIPFKNLINDAYCRDISIKIRSHLEIKRKQGDVITAFVPYGYKKNDKDKHKLEIDVYAANVVKDIFRMKLHGKSQDAIACELNSSGILPPAEYKASTGSNYQTCFKTKEKSEWTSVMVRRILTNEVYTKQIAKLQNDVRRITANKSGLYEDYREQLITAEELCQYQKEYESRVNEIEAQITELLYRRSLYEKDFHIDEGWEETVNKYLSKRKLTRELVEAFVSEIVFTDNNIEVKLLYDDFLKELLEVAEEREVGSNG
jgi:DNA invertase Pin-like site-specific DNA recombinase